MKSFTHQVLPLAFASVLFACSTAKPEVKSADDAATEEDAPKAEADTASTNEAADSEGSKDESTNEEDGYHGAPPKDIVTSPETTFVLDFVASEIGEKTEERCRKQAGDDMKKFSECKRRVQDKLGMPMLKFEEKEGKWWWLTYDRKGSQLVLLHKVEFELGEQTKNTLTIHPKGRDTGRRPKVFPSQVVITLPNENSIELQDPTHGRMMYRARIGILEQTQNSQ